VNIEPFIAVFLVAVLAWETIKVFNSWRAGVSVLAGIRVERNTAPKRFWALITLHSILIGLVALVALNLLGALLT
jgi:hypothetical protein